MDLSLLKNLPSPFYRVTIKALVFDEKDCLLVGQMPDKNWEMPGGGFEHDESMEECLRRELQEELGAEIAEIGQVKFIYRGRSLRGWMITRIAVPVKLKSFDFKFGDMVQAKFVSKEELLNLEFAADEGTIKDCVDELWPSSN